MNRYRVVENKPYGTWAVEELWEGGVIRSPYPSREAAIEREEEILQYLQLEGREEYNEPN